MTASLVAATAALAVLAALPGPDVAVVGRYALSGGLAAAARCALGVIVGLLIWGVLTALGLAALLAASPTAYAVVHLLGAAYLLVLGVAVLRGARRRHHPDAPHRTRRAFTAGLVTNLLNPKIAVFYTGVLPALVPVELPVRTGLLVLVAIHVVVSVPLLLGWAGLLSRSRRLAAPAARRVLERMTGVVLVGFAVRLLADAA